MPRLYVLRSHDRSVGDATTDFLLADPQNVGEAPRCDACGSFVGMLRWEPPLRAEIETWGTKFGDLAFGPGDSFLVSERFRVLWEREHLVGLEGFEPVEIVKVRHRGKRINEAPPRYLRVCTVRSQVAFDAEASGVVWSTPPGCNVCLNGIAKGWQRVVLRGEATEDLFLARGHPGDILASERFKRFCEQNAITNCTLVPADEASRWF